MPPQCHDGLGGGDPGIIEDRPHITVVMKDRSQFASRRDVLRTAPPEAVQVDAGGTGVEGRPLQTVIVQEQAV
jgi:hypothetical protein